MSTEEDAVKAVVLTQELGKRRRERDRLKRKGIVDPQRDLIIENLERILDHE